MLARPRATVQELYNVPEDGKAEIVSGELVRMSPAGGRPDRVALKIVSSLVRHEDEHGGSCAIPDNVGFLVHLPNRGSFTPDGAWYTGSVEGMGFLTGAPAFAIEVRSKGDYGPAAERAIAAKIADYFAAGTQVVWDVNLLSPDVVKVYRAEHPAEPDVYRRGQMAEAEQAVPTWRFPVDRLFS